MGAALDQAATEIKTKSDALDGFTTETDRKNGMISKDLLPSALMGRSGYQIGDLYKTDAPCVGSAPRETR